MARIKFLLGLVFVLAGLNLSAVADDKIVSCCESTGVCRDQVLESSCVRVGTSLGEAVSCDDDPDEDGLVGCDDLCPFDPDKTDPGICGCGWGDPLLEAEKRCSWAVIDSYPPNCANDASCPYDANNVYIGGGIDSFDLTLDPVVDVSELAVSDFFVESFYGTAADPTSVESVTPIDENSVLVALSSAIPVFRTTCLYFTDGAAGEPLLCATRQPGDVDNSGRPTVTDVLELIDGLNGLVRLEPWQCDVDLSGACNVTDILEAIDLLNGITCQIYSYQPVNLPCLPMQD